MEWLRKAVAVGQRAPFPEFSGQSQTMSPEQMFTVLLAHFDLHQAQGHRSCAREVLELAQQFTGQSPDLHYRWLRKWARWLDSVGRKEEALEVLQKHLRRLRGKLNNPTRNAEMRMEIGILLDRSGRKEEALKFFRDAAARYRRLNHHYNYIAALFNSASVLHDLGLFNEALKACRKAVAEGASEHKDLDSHLCLQIANSLESQKHLNQAASHYRQAEEHYGQLGHRRQQSDILYRLGWLALKSKRQGEAARLLRLALELKRETDYALGLAWYHWARAEAYRGGGLVRKAFNHYRSALDLSLSARQEALAAHCRIVLFQLRAKSEQQLPSFARLGTPTAADAVIEQGRSGLYLDHDGDGYSLDVFREPGDTPKARLERLTLGRLLQDLEKVSPPAASANLMKQQEAVRRWSERQGRA